MTTRPRDTTRDLTSTTDDGQLTAALREMHRDPAWPRGGVATRVLVESADRQVSLIALKPGTRLGGCRLAGRATIQVLSGRVFLEIPQGGLSLPAGSVQALPPGLSHDLDAIDESTLLVTHYGMGGQPAQTPTVDER